MLLCMLNPELPTISRQHRDHGQEGRPRQGDAGHGSGPRYSAVRAPGRIPGMNEPCSRRLFAISSGWNIRRFQKKQKEKISVIVGGNVDEAASGW